MSYDSLKKLYFKDNKSYLEIYNNRFNSENSMKIDIFNQNCKFFFFYHIDILKMLFEIDNLNRKLDDVIKTLPGIAYEFYIKKSLIDEILYTNEIEGVISTRKEIHSIIEDIEKNNGNKKKLSSITNKYLKLLNSSDEVNSVRDIRKIYDELVLEDILLSDPDDKPDGEIFRKKAVYIKNEYSGKIIHEGLNPEFLVISELTKALEILNDENTNILVRVAIFHYLFSYIHPFYDGNGRLNRYISSLYLSKYYNSIIGYRLSLTIKENKKQYYEAFNDTNSDKNKGDISTFVYEYLDIIKKSFIGTIDYLTEKKVLLKEIEDKLRDYNRHEATILYILIQAKIFSAYPLGIENIVRASNLSATLVRATISTLLEKKLIKVEKSGRKNVYLIKDDDN